MKILKILIIVFGITSAWFVLRMVGLRFFNIPTSSMENTIPYGTRIMVWKMHFQPADI